MSLPRSQESAEEIKNIIFYSGGQNIGEILLDPFDNILWLVFIIYGPDGGIPKFSSGN